MITAALSPSPTRPEMTQIMYSFDVAVAERSQLRAQQSIESAARVRAKQSLGPATRRPITLIAPDDDRLSWRARIAILALAGAIVGGIAWARYVPRYAVIGQPLGRGRAAVVLLQGADQAPAMFEQQVYGLVAEVPDVTFVMANAQHPGNVGRRWVTGPGWDDAARTKAASFAQIDALMAKLRDAGIQSDDVYLGGYDEGGQVALDYAASRGLELGGVILLSAGVPPWGLSDLAGFRPARAFVAHGTHDEEVQRLGSERVQNALQAGGAETRFRSYAGGRELPHDVTEELAAFIDAHR